MQDALSPENKHPLLGLLVSQFLGAFNDNIYKMILSLFAVHMATGAAAGGTYIPLIGAIFILPFILFSGYAGYLADAFSKRQVLVSTKVFEIIVMGLGSVAFLTGRMEWMLGVLFLMALQSTVFSPAKYGILPEIVPTQALSRANGLIEMSTFLAIILGTTVGSAMFAVWKGHLGMMGLVLIAIAIAGSVASLGIPRVPPSGKRNRFRLNPWGEIVKGLTRLYGEKPLWLAVLGIAYFWFLGALLQMALILLGKEVLGLDDLRVGLLQTFLAIGIGVGSLAAGRLSGGKVELGLVPLGALGMGGFALLLAAVPPSYTSVAAVLSLLGVCGGLFIVPLNAFVQHKSGAQEKGRLLATTNFLSMGGVLLASGTLWICRNGLRIPADQMILIFGLVTLLSTVYVLRLLPDFLVRFLLWMLTHTLYRIRMVGQEHVPLRGPALLICNHVSFIDGLLVSACVQRFIRFMVYRGYYHHKMLHGFFRLAHAIPIAGGNREEVMASLQRARQELRQGHVVCIFAEGAISRTGNLLRFKRGLERIMQGLEVPVIPVHLDRVWGSLFSFQDGRFICKWPRRLPYPVTVSFGSPMPASTTAEQARQAIQELGCEAVAYRRTPRDLLHRRFIATAKRRWGAFCMADATGKKLTYGKTLVASLLLARWLCRQRPQDDTIGLLLPASVGGALANIGVLLAGKIPVNLNFTAAPEALTAAVQQCGIRTIVTSRRFLRQANIDAREGLVDLEEMLQQTTLLQKARVFCTAFILPSRLLQRFYTRRGQAPDALATVMFSSGSTGTPKGVMLSHDNILSNIEGMEQVFALSRQDRMMGILPWFHAFGFTATLWFPLIAGCGAVYHPNPLHARSIGKMVRAHKATILLSTPTFCGMILKHCPPADFASLRYVLVGGERLRADLAQAFKARYGIELLEGYGCTEMAPVVAVNVPDVQHGTLYQTGHKPGTVGHPLPGVAVKVVHPETGQPLPGATEGLLLVKGRNRMLGYLGQPDSTAEVLRDGWYVTGDMATIDDDGFIRITDRLSRFRKIGGEMVPHSVRRNFSIDITVPDAE